MKIDILFKDSGSLALQKNAQVFYKIKRIQKVNLFSLSALCTFLYQKSMLLSNKDRKATQSPQKGSNMVAELQQNGSRMAVEWQ